LLSDLSYISPEDVAAGKVSGGVALMMRHAERHPFIGGDGVISAGLTERGFQQAYQFGEQLSLIVEIGKVYCSPIARCIHTAQSILEGAGLEAIPRLKWWLFSPFLNVVGSAPPRVSDVQVYSDEFNSRYQAEKLKMVLERIKYPSDSNIVNLYITHDTTVMPILAYLLGMDRVHFHASPGYLQGISLKRLNGHVELAGFRP
jgi:hypothetical protein